MGIPKVYKSSWVRRKSLLATTVVVITMAGCSDEGRVRVIASDNNQSVETQVVQPSNIPQDATQPIAQTSESSNTQLELITSPVIQQSGPTPPEFLTGQTYNLGGVGPSGGIVYFLAGGGSVGNTGLEVAPADAIVEGVQAQFGWGCDGDGDFLQPVDVEQLENLPVITTIDANPGSFNTEQIIANNCAPSNGGISAAQAAADVVWPDGSTGGYLPNREELILLRFFIMNNSEGVLAGSMNPARYWSSSEVDAANAWTVRFDISTSGDDSTTSDKFNFQYVRAVKSF